MTEGEREAIRGRFSGDDSIAELKQRKIQLLGNSDNEALDLPRSSSSGKSRSSGGGMEVTASSL